MGSGIAPTHQQPISEQQMFSIGHLAGGTLSSWASSATVHLTAQSRQGDFGFEGCALSTS